MPNFDSGTYFLTVLIPISDECVDDGDGSPQSPEQLVRNALICLPTAEQALGQYKQKNKDHVAPSPFACSSRAHLARFVVIDDAVYNGRDQQNVLVMTAKNINPIVPKKVDKLNAHYLFFSADFDADSDSVSEVRSFLTELWEGAEPQLRSVFQYCRNFEKVKDAKGFCDYIISCQVETTMPFHDYWATPPTLPEASVGKPAMALGVSAVVGLAALCIWFANAAFDASSKVQELLGGASWWALAGCGVVAFVVFWGLFARKGLFNVSKLGLILLFLSVLAVVAGAGNAIYALFSEEGSLPWGWIGIGLIALALAITRWLYSYLMKFGSNQIGRASCRERV